MDPMRTIVFIVAAAVAAVALGSAAATRPAPALSIAARQPVQIRGVHFLPRELVRVTATSDATETQRVRASASGSFLVSFDGMVLDRCSGLRVRAAGSRGSVALLKLPLPACLPARNP